MCPGTANLGLVGSGMAQKVGIGGMDGGRWKDHANLGHRRKIYPYRLPLDRMYTLDFVNQNVGVELKQRLLGG
jgi:hypothetical protein